MNKEIIKSYLLASHYLQERVNYGLSKTPQIIINQMLKEEDKYKIKGNLYIDLGESCSENNIFESTLLIKEQEVILQSQVQTINTFISNLLHPTEKMQVKGAPSVHEDIYRVSIIKGNKYLIHLTDQDVTKVYAIDDNYELITGIPENLNLYSPPLPKTKKRKKFINLNHSRY